jgi:hypothetical protein
MVEVVGCLVEGPSAAWMLTRGSHPKGTQTQSTSSTALAAAALQPLGTRRYALLGTDVFSPLSHAGQKVAVKGVLIRTPAGERINVTSLQQVAASCEKPPGVT